MQHVSEAIQYRTLDRTSRRQPEPRDALVWVPVPGLRYCDSLESQILTSVRHRH